MAVRLGARVGPAVLLLACATTPVGGKLTQRTFDFQSYAVDAPAGDEWGLAELDQVKQRVGFQRATVAVLAGQVSATTLIDVYWVPIAPAGWDLGEEQHADRYRDEELRNMNEEGVKKGQYELRNVRKGVETVAGMKLYSLRYETVAGSWLTGGKQGAAVLFLHFPPDFATRRAFYGFLITALTVRGSIYTSSPDLKPIESVIASFRLKNSCRWSSTCALRCSDGTTREVTATWPCFAGAPQGSACTILVAGDRAAACAGSGVTFQECGDCTPWKKEP